MNPLFHVMRKSLTAPILLSLVALTALTGCQAIQEESRNFAGREERLSNVVGNVWRLDFKWPGNVRATQINEALQQRARDICQREELGMLPLSGAVDAHEDGSAPSTAWLPRRSSERRGNLRSEGIRPPSKPICNKGPGFRRGPLHMGKNKKFAHPKTCRARTLFRT